MFHVQRTATNSLSGRLQCPSTLERSLLRQWRCRYAQVGATTVVGQSPPRPKAPPTPPISGGQPGLSVAPFDSRVISELCRLRPPALSILFNQYDQRDGRVLDHTLPYESRPPADRKAACSTSSDDPEDVLMVAHAAQDRSGCETVTYSSGFLVDVPGSPGEQATLVTCAHTLEEVSFSWSPLDYCQWTSSNRSSKICSRTQSSRTSSPRTSGSLIISGTPAAPAFHPVSAVLSTLHRSDLLVLSISPQEHARRLRTLPLSPYPVQVGTHIRAHFATEHPPTLSDGWVPWVGGMWRKWMSGTVVGYRDFAGREAKVRPSTGGISDAIEMNN